MGVSWKKTIIMWVEWDWDHIFFRASVDWGSILGSVLRVLACIVDFEQTDQDFFKASD